MELFNDLKQSVFENGGVSVTGKCLQTQGLSHRGAKGQQSHLVQEKERNHNAQKAVEQKQNVASGF